MTDREPTVVLVIDADSVRRGMLACALPPTRFVLEFAKSPEVGLDLLGRLHPEVVIVGRDEATDDLCQRIRLLPAGDRCMLMLMDERFADAAMAAEAEAAGADVALAFPLELALFEDHLERRRQSIARTTARYAAERRPAASPHSSAAPQRRRAPHRAWRAFRERVDGFFDQLDGLDYYQLLEVPRGATNAEIKDAYFERSMEFHPDRFMRLEDDLLRTRIYEVYKRMSEAFRVLTRPDTRAAYEQELSAPPAVRSLRYQDADRLRSDDLHRPSVATTPAGRRYVQFGDRARAEGNLRSARMYFSLAVQCEPNNTALRRELDNMSAALGAR